jgi:glycosyltransferase involved in cell wall biosynthesis
LTDTAQAKKTNSAAASERIKVTFFQRKSRPNRNFSLEFIFDDVRKRLKDRIDAVKVVAPYYSNGLFRRLAIGFDAWRKQSGINHVTGDTTFSAIPLVSKRTVLTILDCGVLARTKGWKRRIIKWIWFDWPIQRTSIVTTISTSSRNEIIEVTGCCPEKVRVVPVAVSDAFEKCDKQFNKQRPRILHIGTYPNKNLPRLIEALDGVSCTLVVIGKIDAPTMELIAKHNIELENHFDIPQEDVIAHYGNSDMVSFASVYEGFGMPIIEANVVGRAVVTSNVASMPEVAGDAACLIDPFDVQSIRTGILKVIENDEYRDQLVQLGYQNASRFQPEKIAQMYLDIYTEIFEKQSSRIRKMN